MLFFKDIRDEKLKNPEFKSLFDTECHICKNTIRIIAELENNDEKRMKMLDALTIPLQDYDALKEGEYCDPEQVVRMSRYLGLMEKGRFKDCPRR